MSERNISNLDNLHTRALASMNCASSQESLLENLLDLIHRSLSLTSATVRLKTAENRLDLVSAVGLGRNLLAREQNVVPPGEAPHNGPSQPKSTDTRYLNIPIPTRDGEHVFGYIDLYYDLSSEPRIHGIRTVLNNIAIDLGDAIIRCREGETLNRASILEERNRIAQELHDSLAQSLASLRFQIRVLDETLHQGNESALWSELERIEQSMDEAHTELRELIANFRAPVGEKSLVEGVTRLVERFRKDTGIHIFLQQEWSNQNLSAEVESQIYRIIQEALANIRKHSGAKHVRVMMRNDSSGFNLVLIEDDGTGMTRKRDGSEGEHVGLSIMQERAERVGGKLKIESEPGEGTRIQLLFNFNESIERAHGINNGT